MKEALCQTVSPHSSSAEENADRWGISHGWFRAFAAKGLLVVTLAFLTPVGTAAPEASEDSAANPTGNETGRQVASEADRLKNWPNLLGPAAGVSPATGLLINWNGETGEGIKWKTRIPPPGYSSPIYWEGKLYLTGATASTRVVYCICTPSIPVRSVRRARVGGKGNCFSRA